MKPLEMELGQKVVTIRILADADVTHWREVAADFDALDTPRYGLLLDAREASLLSSAEAREVGRTLARGWRAVAILTVPGVRYGIARIVQAFAQAEDQPIQTFTDPAEAQAWLADRVDPEATG